MFGIELPPPLPKIENLPMSTPPPPCEIWRLPPPPPQEIWPTDHRKSKIFHTNHLYLKGRSLKKGLHWHFSFLLPIFLHFWVRHMVFSPPCSFLGKAWGDLGIELPPPPKAQAWNYPPLPELRHGITPPLLRQPRAHDLKSQICHFGPTFQLWTLHTYDITDETVSLSLLNYWDFWVPYT